MTVDVGKCCACGGTENVRNFVMLSKPAPVPGTGWGCVACGLPQDGAIAVVCDQCTELNRDLELKEVIMGYASGKMRVPIHALRDVVFDHNLSFHPEVKQA